MKREEIQREMISREETESSRESIHQEMTVAALGTSGSFLFPANRSAAPDSDPSPAGVDIHCRAQHPARPTHWQYMEAATTEARHLYSSIRSSRGGGPAALFLDACSM